MSRHTPEDLNRSMREEIAAYSAAARTVAERRRWQVISLLADNASLADIVATTGYRPRTIREIAQRYKQDGAAALVDQRTQSKGAPMLLSPELQHELWQALDQPPPRGDVWTGPQVARWITEKTGVQVHRQRGWEYLQRARSRSPSVTASIPEQDGEL